MTESINKSILKRICAIVGCDYTKELEIVVLGYHRTISPKCEQPILSQGEAENKVIDIVDYDEKLKSFYINGNQPSTEALQKENTNLKEQLSKMRHDLDKVTSTLEIKAKDLAWWQNRVEYFLLL